MSLDARSRAGSADIFNREFEFGFGFDAESEADSPLAENVVTVIVAAVTVLFVSSVAVVMYLA